MDRKFVKEKFLSILSTRPATVKFLVNPTDSLILECFEKNNKVMEFVKPEWLTLGLLTGLAEIYSRKNFYRYGSSYFEKFSQELLSQLPLPLTARVIIKNPSLITLFPAAPNNMWVKSLLDTCNISYEDIPEVQRTEEVKAVMFARYPDDTRVFPHDLLTDSIVDKALSYTKHSESVFNDLPVHYMTLERFHKIFDLCPNLSITNQNIPKSFWTPEYAERAVAAQASNIMYVPKNLITKEIAIKAVESYPDHISHVPDRLIDEDLAFATMLSGRVSDCGNILKFFSTKEKRLELFKRASAQVNTAQLNSSPNRWSRNDILIPMQNYYRGKEWGDITEEEWLENLTVCPQALYFIEKDKQTSEIMTTFISHASLEVIDALAHAGKLNFKKLKKEHVPFLLGATQPDLARISERKVRGKREALGEVAIAEEVATVSVDMTDGEYREFSGLKE